MSARIAFFWDESYLWGLIAYDTFRELGIGFDLLASADIRAGRLDDYHVLFVPGGWASDKIAALGAEGRDRIRDFVDSGSAYLGICGGAGLALSHATGLGLAPIGRVPTGVRLPSFSGPVIVEPVAGHQVWKGVSAARSFHAWWPGQFSLEDGDVAVLASYKDPAEGSFVTDLPVLPDMDWPYWEERYGIRLDPSIIAGEPAVIETSFGRGKVLLSYIHFETPGDAAGHQVLVNMLEYLAPGSTRNPDSAHRRSQARSDGSAGPSVDPDSYQAAARLVSGLRKQAAGLLEFGERNYLWFRRNDWILQWRRGVRGVEYSTLFAMLDRLSSAISGFTPQTVDEAPIDWTATADALRSLSKIAGPFFANSRELLLLERDALTRGPLNPLKTEDENISRLRELLFSSSKRCGGLYREIVGSVDSLLLPLLRAQLDRG